MIEWNISALVLLIDQNGVPLRKGSALAVLSREANPMSLPQQSAECERLGGRPVYADPRLDRRAAGVEKASDRAMNIEPFRHDR